MPSGRHWNSQGKEIVAKVYHYCEQMSKKTAHRQAYSEGILKRTVHATGVSRSAVARVIHESKENIGASFASPKKRYEASRQNLIVDD